MGLRIAFVGSGNVAWNLASELDRAGHRIVQVVSRDPEHAKALAQRFGAYYGDVLSELYSDFDLLILSVSDDAYEALVQSLKVPPGVVVCHTSGPVPAKVLEPLGPDYGVFYPLQSFNTHRLKHFEEIPLLIEGVDGRVERMLTDLADDLSNQVKLVSSAQRKQYHLAAVFANNFTNLMYDCAERYLEQERLDFDLLKPLIYETALRIKDNSPRTVQTGPAKRHDLKVIREHAHMIQDPMLKRVYLELSELIQSLQ